MRAGWSGEAGPPLDHVREVRLAIVMYGGVSLSIYMNGVAQELFRLVRSTAPVRPAAPTTIPDRELRGSERAYRKVAQATLDPEGGPPPPATSAVLQRFVIDVLSGTSAGGINAVFLAKALANEQGLDGLQRLWIEEGDIGKLLNDRESRVPGVAQEHPPESLLNSGRMYVKLVEAFDSMDRENPWDSSSESPLADEIDLFVTTTDLNGFELPIRFANTVADERRYRNVYRFRYSVADLQPGAPQQGPLANSFVQGNNPFLAFACRCTSAFPLAFKPMVLRDIDNLLSPFPQYAGRTSSTPEWQAFYPDYVPDPVNPVGVPFAERPFADGGALDNKPFGYAIDILRERRAQVPVDRKLLFVDPDPTPPTTGPDPDQRPNALENFLAQSVMLPRQETIRDDLNRLDDLNRIARRIDGALHEVLLHVPDPTGDVSPIERSTPESIDREFETEVAARPGAAGYHWLRMESVIEDIADVIARSAGIPTGKEYLVAIRALLKAWRDRAFEPPAGPAGAVADPGTGDGGVSGPGTVGAFLWRLDAPYRFRRLSLLERRSDALFLGDGEGQQLFSRFVALRPGDAPPLDLGDLREPVRQMKSGIARATFSLASAESFLRGVDLGFRGVADQAGIGLDDLDRILRDPTDAGRRERAVELLNARLPAVNQTMARIVDARVHAADEAFDALSSAIGAAKQMGPAGELAATMIGWAYQHFEEFDTVAFPLQYGSNAGEGDLVEVVRISPGDATGLLATSTESGAGKVTGQRLGHFGAFLDRLWRENDIMWGRLDAAEILIESLYPPRAAAPERALEVGRLRNEAFRAILHEELATDDLLRLFQAGQEAERGGVALSERMRNVVDALSTDAEVVELFRETYRRPDALPPRAALRNVGRSAHVMGQVFRSIAYERGGSKLALPFSVVARMGQLLAGLVEAAVPRSFWHMLAKHWFSLLYLVELLALAAGFLFSASGVTHFAIVALLATTALNVALWLVARRLRTGQLWRSILWAIAGVVVFAAIAGVITLAVFQALRTSDVHDWLPWAAWGVIAAFVLGAWLTHFARTGKSPPSENRRIRAARLGFRRRSLWLAGMLLLVGAVGVVLVLAVQEYVHLGQVHDWIPLVPARSAGALGATPR